MTCPTVSAFAVAFGGFILLLSGAKVFQEIRKLQEGQCKFGSCLVCHCISLYVLCM